MQEIARYKFVPTLVQPRNCALRLAGDPAQPAEPNCAVWMKSALTTAASARRVVSILLLLLWSREGEGRGGEGMIEGGGGETTR